MSANGLKPGTVWVFDEQRLEQSLAAWRDEALAAYPHQQERILITVEAMRDFLHSEQARGLTMGRDPGEV